MHKLIAGLAGALSIGFLASAAQAAPLGAAGSASATGASTEVIQVHGLHSSCQRDRFGWHRAYIWGRQRCAPAWMKHHHRPHMKHHKHYKHGKKKH
ncbi:MAG: hypothetical protein J0H65_03775 [Rhizobiales bacterium]|nr:hypothetical protein [Hyphomicrobiales bacterium]